MKPQNHTAVLTGSTGGIGLETAKILAQKGWNLILVNRSKDKTDRQIEQLRKDHPEQTFTGFTANIIDTSDILHVTQEIVAAHPEISALYNIAGILTDKRVSSPQQLESHFAVNTLAPYLFAQALRTALRAGSVEDRLAVIVNFSSSAIKSVKKLEVSKLSNPEKIGGLMGAYARSKLACDVVTKLLEAELLEEGILIQSVDPGPTKSPMTDAGDGMPWFVKLLRPLIFKPASVQAERLVEGVEAGVAEGKSGLYISEGKRKPFPKIAQDPQTQSELKELLDGLNP